MLIMKFLIILIMSIGLVFTLSFRLYGTVIILVGAILYAFVVDPSLFQTNLFMLLLSLVFVAEIGARGLRIFLTKHHTVSREYSTNAMACNLAGIIVSDALLGPLLGVTLWEIIVGKAILPRLDHMRQVLIRLLLVATLRTCCGLIMIIFIVKSMI